MEYIKRILPSLILIFIIYSSSTSCKLQTKDSNRSINQTQIIVLKDSNAFYKINARYPIDNLDTGNVIEKFVLREVNARKSAWQLGGDIYIEEQKTNEAFPDRSEIHYEFQIDYDTFFSKAYQSKSYLFTSYEYTGGANGNAHVQSFNFDKSGIIQIETILNLEENRDIELTKLLASEAEKSKDWIHSEMLYQGLGLAYLKEDGKTLDLQKCQCDGFLFASNFNHFIIEDKGITFYFDEYQIAPGAAGITQVTISWKKLSPYLVQHIH